MGPEPQNRAWRSYGRGKGSVIRGPERRFVDVSCTVRGLFVQLRRLLHQVQTMSINLESFATQTKSGTKLDCRSVRHRTDPLLSLPVVISPRPQTSMDQSSLASPSNPDMSPNASPLTDHVACVGSPSLREPPSLDEDEISHNLDETLSLTSTDIKADPILRSLAKQQSLTRLKDNAVSISSSANFKARPAPKIVEGAGPRMTKAAALRQGLKWETPKWEKREKEEIVFDQVPGHKRAGLNIVSTHPEVGSCARPSHPLHPRQSRRGRTRHLSCGRAIFHLPQCRNVHLLPWRSRAPAQTHSKLKGDAA